MHVSLRNNGLKNATLIVFGTKEIKDELTICLHYCQTYYLF